MPFRKWTVEPVFLSRKPLPPDKRSGGEFDATANGSLVKSLEQLACVVKLADRIFEEIGSECRLVLERTERLKVKVQVCQDAVARLDAKTVSVPVSDLAKATTLLRRQQYVTYVEQSSQMFLPATRPPCVDKLYSGACVTPVALICTIDRYRSDGCTGSQMFMVTPILGDAKRKRRKMLDIETRRPASFALARDWQENVEFGLSTTTSMLSQHMAPSVGRGTLQSLAKDLDRLPSPEEQAMALSLEYPSAVVPVDISGSSFLRMTKFRRSLIHADFVIKRKKTKRKSKRRHTVCEGSSKELEEAVQSISVAHTSCQTDDVPDVGSLSSLRRSFSRRRGRTMTDNIRRETVALDGSDSATLKRISKSPNSAEADEKDESAGKENSTNKKSSKPSLKSRACSFNPISSLSAALSVAVKMRQSSRTAGKADDGRSSSGNWSGSSSTRASVDSDQQQALAPRDGARSQSRNSLGKDSVLSDATQQDTDARSQDDVLIGTSTQFSTKYPAENQDSQVKTSHQWVYDADQARHSSTSTPERNTSDTTSTPLVLSPYLGRRAHLSPHPFPGVLDDGESSVYSVDTDGYYTSMHTDSGLWSKSVQASKSGESVNPDSFRYRRRQESQSSVSTIGNNSLNSFLSRTATEGSSNQSSLKKQKPPPPPPPRVSSVKSSSVERDCKEEQQIPKEQEIGESDKSDSPSPPHNGSNSESDYEVQDRIRVKTTINSSRYPSMCAVSPETTDDETEGATDDRYKTIKSQNINIVVAEVHREDSAQDMQQELVNKCKAPVFTTVETESTKQTGDLIDNLDSQQDEVFYAKNKTPNGCSTAINMYGNQTPVLSSFSSSLLKSDSIEFSSVIPSSPVTTFSPDSFDHKQKPSVHTVDNDKHIPITTSLPTQEGGQNNGLIVTSHPVSTQQLSHDVEKSLIPLKYAQHITVTPIPRSEASTPPEFTPTKFADYPFQRSLRNSHQGSCSSSMSPNQTNSSRISECNTSSVSTYTPFRISSLPMSTDYMKYSKIPLNSQETTSHSPVKPVINFSDQKPLSPTRTVARVTLDPAGKVVFSSSSLGRTKESGPSPDLIENQESNVKPRYATLPMYQTRNINPELAVISENNSNVHLPHSAINDTLCLKRSQPNSATDEQHKVQVQNSIEHMNSNVPPSGFPECLGYPSSSCQITDSNHSNTRHGATSTPQMFPGINSSTGKEPYFRPTRGGRFCRTYFPAHLISSSSQQSDPVEQRPPAPPSPSESFRSDSSSSSHSSSYVKQTPVYSSTFASPLKHATISERLAQQRNFNMQRRTFPTSISCPTSISSAPSNSSERTNPSPNSDQRSKLNTSQATYVSTLQPVDQKSTNSVSPSQNNRNQFNTSYYQPRNNYQSSPNRMQQMNTSGLRPTLQQTSLVNVNSSKTVFPLEARNAYNASSASNFNNSQSSPIYPSANTSSQNGTYRPQNPVFITDPSQKVQDRKIHSSFTSSQPPDVVPSSALPPSTLDITKSSSLHTSPNPHRQTEPDSRNLTNSSLLSNASTPCNTPFNKQTQQKQSLSAGELFAIIHSSKKKHNIKTESEKSLSPMSSRSSSPGVGQTPTRGSMVETGFLSKRNTNLLTPGDRHSWGSNLSLPSERKSLVQDRLGKTKPTSMHDFKMLLLQTRGGSTESNRRLSAAELLKVSPPKKADFSSNLSSQSLPSSPVKSAKLVQTPSSTGHSTVPLKRSIRTKSPYRYDSAYPPIWEDCSEDMESTSDTDRYLRSPNSSDSSVFLRNERNSQSCNAMNSQIQKHTPSSKATSTWV